MKTNNPSKKNDDEINLKEIILTVWSEKLLIISFCLIFLIIGYIYGDKRNKIYQTQILIRDIPTQTIFGNYLSQITNKIEADLIDYNKLLDLNIISSTNMIKFLNKNNEFGEFKSFLKKKNVNLNRYFFNKIKREKNEENIKDYTKYTLKFSKPFPAQKFLYDYIVYANKITELEIKEKLKDLLETELEVYKKSFSVAKLLNYEHAPQEYYEMSEIPSNNQYIQFYYLYPLGTKVLSFNIDYLEQKIDRIDNFKLDYKLVVDKASPPTLLTKTAKTIALFALLLGLFFSIIVIFIRSILKS